MEVKERKEVSGILDELSSEIDYSSKELAIILAAGHGKRIKSQKSKMLHNIWGVPTVQRVYNACAEALKEINFSIVVGIKAEDVSEVIGKRKNTIFAYQKEQNGTGHAVQAGLDQIDEKLFSDGIVYILPGDMGLIDADTIKMLKHEFIKTGSGMIVLTGLFEGDFRNNNYGRIIRPKNIDADGNPARENNGEIIEIIEHKDILVLNDNEPYLTTYKGKKYKYSKQELLENREYNSGVYAVDFKKLVEQIRLLGSNNVQKEIYITELISLFNRKGYSVSAVHPKEQFVVMGFNNKSVLKEMEQIARRKAYEQLKDIIEIDDPDDFFIDETIIKEIIEADQKNIPLDIHIGTGVHIGRGVKMNYNLDLGKNVFLEGNIKFGKNVKIWQNVHLSTFQNQDMIIGNNVEILWGDIIKGNIVIDDNSRIESSVNMTGSDEYPLRIGKNVLIKGTTYVFGSIIEDDLHIEHSVLIKKRVGRITTKNGTVQSVKFFLPMPSGIDAVEDL